MYQEPLAHSVCLQTCETMLVTCYWTDTLELIVHKLFSYEVAKLICVHPVVLNRILYNIGSNIILGGQIQRIRVNCSTNILK